MFYLVNILTNTRIAACNTKNELLVAWLQHVNGKNRYNYDGSAPCFDNLSLADNDIFVEHTYTLSRHDNNFIYIPRTIIHPRTFRVYDDKGRIVDIREWPEMYEKAIFPKYESRWTKTHVNKPQTGSKDHSHRAHGASMAHRDLRNFSYEPDPEDIPDNIKIKTAKTTLTNGDRWDFYEKNAFHGWNTPKSWKNQAKSRHQWAKHKNKPQYNSLKNVPLDITDEYWHDKILNEIYFGFDGSDDMIAS